MPFLYNSHNFDRYIRPAEYNTLNLAYIIRRGAKLGELLQLTLAKLQTYNQSDYLIVKVAAGINNLTKFVYDSGKRNRVLTVSQLSADNLVSILEDFRSRILAARPGTIVSFCTIPTASLKKFQDCKNLQAPILSESDLTTAQVYLDQVLDEVNSRIIALNSGTSHTVSLHSDIRRSSIRRSSTIPREGRRTTIRSKVNLLYDGLHATSNVKRKWYNAVLSSFLKDSRKAQQQ
ncbi:hypothetical protein HOLleu_09054 [Holothuria leucospilota]|uniref:Uncharacterized protein n=1 Tax=Holothuria leucospilota TaxID=206669 RepID=A0A9Q1CIJ4_HOLLE|nr:hypothetical protein HOLleu_09054 [Holothuria leucospilota]